MRRPALLLIMLGLLALLPGTAAAAPEPDAAPGATPSPDPAPQPPAPPAPTPTPTYTPPTPTYTPPEPTFTPPVRPVGPTPAAPGTAGADMVQASGRRIALAAKTESGTVAPAPPETQPAVTPEPPATEAAPEATAPPATVEDRALSPDPIAATLPDESQLAPAAAPPLPITPSGGDDDGNGLPLDGLALLVLLLAGGIALGVRALRHGQRRLAVPLLAYCAAYLLVVGGVFAGVAEAADVADLEATPGDGEVLVTWTPPASGTVVLVAGLTPPARCESAERTVPYEPSSTAAVDTGLANGVTIYYAACVREGEFVGDPKIVSATPVASTDGVAPPAITGLNIRVENGRVRGRWELPPAEDLSEVVVVRRFGSRPPTSPRDGVVVYRGLGRTASDFPVSPKRRIWYSAFAIDNDENVSMPASASLPRFNPPLYSPRDGAILRGSSLFRWRAVRSATYYNIQIWRGAVSRKVISTWVNTPRYVLRTRLPPGRYSWYVFPGVGPRSAARYLALAGSATFTIR
jgi:hypothetical protein